jgi:hypothetical protein
MIAGNSFADALFTLAGNYSLLPLRLITKNRQTNKNMITLDKIVSSNLEMLRNQEAELLKSLTFVQKARQLFEEQNNGRPKRGRKPNVQTATASPKTRQGRPVRKGSHLSNIMEVLQQKGKPLPSGELISTLFKQQKKDKNLAHYRQLIYPTLTQAYRKGVLKLKDKKIHLA